MASKNWIKSPSKKRKRNVTGEQDFPASSASEDRLDELERLAGESPKHFNNISKIMSMAYPKKEGKAGDSRAVTALGRIFYRLMMEGRFRESASKTREERVVRDWLKGRLDDYVCCLLEDISKRRTEDQAGRVKILMILVQGEISSSGHEYWRHGIFERFLKCMLLQRPQNNEVFAEFIPNYFLKYEDVRVNALTLLP
jgi:U3 small nucleolar RNA-associated protein 19